MTQQSTTKSITTFVKGIITEAGPLTFPENASLDEENCVLNRDGSRQRRLGMDLEEGAVFRDIVIAADDAVACFLWENAGNDVTKQFAVVQAGQKLLIFNGSSLSISGDILAVIDLTSYITGNTVLGTASGLGHFFIAEGTAHPMYLSYDPNTGGMTLTQYNMLIRDQFGVVDGIAVDFQPGSLTTAHNYNLLNQGWRSGYITAYKADAGSVYPANSQQWFVGKDSNEDFQPPLLKKQEFGTSPAPKGHYIIDAFLRSTYRNAASGLSTATDIETGRPSVVAFAFERVWLAGVKSSIVAGGVLQPNMSGFVFFSRTIRTVTDVGQFHTDADPTSEIDSELVDTDGGFVNIPNSGPIYKLVQKDNTMLVFAQNGIWMIQGDEGGFRATAYQVVKLSDFGVLSGTSVVDVEEAILYWNKGGIYVLSVDENTGRLSSRSLSEDSIQTLYNDIDKVSKTNAIGTFDPVNRRVMWMYNDEEGYDGVNFRNKYNRELVFDMVLTAFYKHQITTYLDPSPYIAGYFPCPDFLRRQEGVRSRGDTITKYLTVRFTTPGNGVVAFSYYRNPQFRDWKSIDGIGASYVSYLITGYEIVGDTSRNKQLQYISTHFKHTETNAIEVDGEFVPENPSGCIMQSQWGWSNSPASGKWGTDVQAYRLLKPMTITGVGPIDYGYEVITNKHRLRGTGKALSIYFRSDEDKDFYLYGWSYRFSGQTSV